MVIEIKLQSPAFWKVDRVYHSGAFVDFGAEVMGNLPTAYVLTKDGSRIGNLHQVM